MAVDEGFDESKVEKSRVMVFRAKKTKNGRTAIRSIIQNYGMKGKKVFDNNTALDVHEAINLSDFLFADFHRESEEFDVARQVFTESGVVPFEVI